MTAMIGLVVGIAVVLAVADSILDREGQRPSVQRPRAVHWSQRRIDAEFDRIVDEQLRKRHNVVAGAHR
jgi:hypothetical protein